MTPLSFLGGGLAALFTTATACAQLAVQDGFESGTFASGWDLTAGIVIQSGSGAVGSGKYVRLAPYSAGTGRELGARFDDVAPPGARGFIVDFEVRIQESSARQFNVHVSDSAGVPNSNHATINLRHQTAWQAYSGTGGWQTLSNLNALVPGQWHRVRITGAEWGLAGAHYDVEVSLAGTTNLTSVASNLTYFQSGNPKTNPACFFVFSSVFGNDPGFDVDEVFAQVTGASPPATNTFVKISGTYPHLAVFSADGEIGIGAVVPWADHLWFVTYPPHQPQGSPDRLWMLDNNLTLTAHPASVGCTDANRLIHRESQQLNLGHYLITSNGTVHVLSPTVLPGRLTGSARHLTAPANKIYIATMEEGLYEVDVTTLAVTELYHDMNTSVGAGQKAAALPGQHGKGLYSSQGRLFYSNNSSGGSFSAWDGTNWVVIETNKFTEITGPGGIFGNDAADDRLWALGWDTRSVILRAYQNGGWTRYRLPKASYTHDSDTGWYTEWPRIREIVDGKLLMHMHGMFYYFPKDFAATQSGGIKPICTYLKMPVDYCWWNGQLVMGRDDASTTGDNPWAGQSHSAPWFGQLTDLEQWGPPAGFGGPWKDDAVRAGQASEPFLVSGFQKRLLHLKHTTGTPVTFTLQVDHDGTGVWRELTKVALPASGYGWYLLPPDLEGIWVRLLPEANATGVTAYFHLSNPPRRPDARLFAGIADIGLTNQLSDGIIRPQSGDARTLQFAANIIGSTGTNNPAYYEIDGSLQLTRKTNAAAESALRSTYTLATHDFSVDAASVLVTEGANRFRLPKTDAHYDVAFRSGWPRGKREVVTERDLFQAHGTIYELPRSDSGGFRRVRPVTTHGKHISDFASWRGLFAVAGTPAAGTNDGHLFRSTDGQAALWFGNVDDLWRMGAPRGTGGPWKSTAVTANVASDPYLMFGYEHKVLELSHDAPHPLTFVLEVDFAADNNWSEYGRFIVPANQTFKHVFPEGYSAHWVRLKALESVTATGTFTYGPSVLHQAFLDWVEPFALPPASTTEALMARDDDADGWPNWVEFMIGSNPSRNDCYSFPPVYALTPSNLFYEVVLRYCYPLDKVQTEVSSYLTQWAAVPTAWELSGVSQDGLSPNFWRRRWQMPLPSHSPFFVRQSLEASGTP